MSFQHWFNSETTWNQHRITSYQRCFSTVKQYGINVISTFTHDIETILHQHLLNKCIQYWINIIPISQTMLIQHQITMLHQCCSQMWDQHYINTYSGYWNNIASTFVQCLFATLDQHNFDEQKTLIQQQTSTLHQRCSQCRINVISTFTHDTETTLHQHSFNVYMQHWINVISMSKKNIDSMTDINIASMLLLILDQCWINVFLLSGIFQCHIWDNSPIRPSKSLLKSPRGEGNHSPPGQTWFERHNLIGWFFCQKRFHWLTQSTGLNNPVLSESAESSDNVQLTICTPVL